MTFCIMQAQEIARSTPDPFPHVGVGSGNETTNFESLPFKLSAEVSEDFA